MVRNVFITERFFKIEVFDFLRTLVILGNGQKQ